MQEDQEKVDEMSFLEIAQILLQYKKNILSIALICALLAGVAVFSRPPVYEGQTTIIIGNTINASTAQSSPMLLLEDPMSLVVRIKSEYGRNQQDLPAVVFIEADKKTNNMIFMKAQGRSPQETKLILDQVTADVLKEHQEILSKRLKIRESREQDIIQQIKNLDEMSKVYEQRMLEPGESMYKFLLLAEKSRQAGEKLQLEKELADSQMALASKVTPSRVVSEPTISEKPINHKVTHVVLAGGIGLIFGSMMILVKKIIFKN